MTWTVGYSGDGIAASRLFQKHDDAKQWLIEALGEQADRADSWADPPNHDCEAMGHEQDPSCPRQVASQLAFLAEDLSLISEDEPFESTVASVEYWIRRCEEAA